MIELPHLICNLTVRSHKVEPIEGDSGEMNDDWKAGTAVQFVLSNGGCVFRMSKGKDVGIDHITKFAWQAHK